MFKSCNTLCNYVKVVTLDTICFKLYLDIVESFQDIQALFIKEEAFHQEHKENVS